MDTSRLVAPPRPPIIAAVLLACLAALSACQQPQSGGSQSFALETPDARGLKTGASVYVAGVKVGNVSAVTLVGRKARVELAMSQEGLLTEGTCARIASYGMTGDMHVELDPPTGKRPLPADHVITCVRTSGDHDKQLTQALRSVVAILDLAATGKGVIGRLLRDETLADSMEAWFQGGGPGAQPTTPEANDDEAARGDEPEPPASAAPVPAPPAPIKPKEVWGPSPPKPPPPKPPPPKSDLVAPF